MEPKVAESRSWSHPGSDTKKTPKKMRTRSQNELKRASQKHHKIMKNVTSDPSAGPGVPHRPQRYPPEPKSHQKAQKNSQNRQKIIEKSCNKMPAFHSFLSRFCAESSRAEKNKSPEHGPNTKKRKALLIHRLHRNCMQPALPATPRHGGGPRPQAL